MTQVHHCAHCGTANPADARFCIDCGIALMGQATTGPTVKLETRHCPWCHVANPVRAQFCVACGHSVDALPPQPQPQPTFKQPTQPKYPPPQPQIYPRVQQPPLYAPRPSRQRPAWNNRQIHPGIIVALLIIGFTLLTQIGHRNGGGIPFFLFFLPLGLLPKLRHGRSIRNYASLFWIIGLFVLFGTGTFWPGILVLSVLWMLLGR